MKKSFIVVTVLFMLALLITSCSDQSATDVATSEQPSVEQRNKFEGKMIPSMEEMFAKAWEQAPSLNRATAISSTTENLVVNGGFEDGTSGWTLTDLVGSYGIDGDPNKIFTVANFDPYNPEAYVVDYMLYPHFEALAHSGVNGASLTSNGFTFAFIGQSIALPDLECSEQSITFEFWVRWKNFSEAWGNTDIAVYFGDQSTNNYIVALQGWLDGLPPYSGEGDGDEAYFEKRTVDVSQFAGQTVMATFFKVTVGPIPVPILHFDIDDVSVTVSGECLSPEDRIGTLIGDIEALVDSGAVSAAHGRAVTNKLDGAVKQLEKGNTQAALNKLQDVIDQTTDLIAAGHISPEDGQAIIDAMNAVIAQLTP